MGNKCEVDPRLSDRAGKCRTPYLLLEGGGEGIKTPHGEQQVAVGIRERSRRAVRSHTPQRSTPDDGAFGGQARDDERGRCKMGAFGRDADGLSLTRPKRKKEIAEIGKDRQ